MMINIVLSPPTILEGAKTFGFRVKSSRSDDRDIAYKNPGEKLIQDSQIGEVTAWVEQLGTMACDASLVVAVEKGHATLSGEVRPFDAGADQRVEEILRALDSLTAFFANCFPETSFSISYSQTATISHVDGMTVGN